MPSIWRPQVWSAPWWPVALIVTLVPERSSYASWTPHHVDAPPDPGRPADPPRLATVHDAPGRPGASRTDPSPPGRGDAHLHHCRDGRHQPPLCLQVGAAVSHPGPRGLGGHTPTRLTGQAAPGPGSAGSASGRRWVPPLSPSGLRGDAYLSTSSARERNSGGMVRPSASAVFRLITSSSLVGCSTGRSPGFTPRKILSTKADAREYR